MQVKIQNQNILITGATGGIGRSIVKSFDEDDNNLLIIGTNENKLNALSQELKSSTKFIEISIIILIPISYNYFLRAEIVRENHEFKEISLSGYVNGGC